MRAALVLLYWADRLDGVACTTRPDVMAGLHVLLGSEPRIAAVDLFIPPEDIVDWRTTHNQTLCDLWAEERRATRRRRNDMLGSIAEACSDLPLDGRQRSWQLVLGAASVPEPAMLIRRILNGQDPERLPALPRKRLKRRPLCLLAAS